MTKNEALMTEQKKSGWYNAMLSLTPDWLKEIQKAEYAALSAIFDAVLDDDLVIIVGHTPMIELLAHYLKPEDVEPNVGLDLKPEFALKELQGILFVQDFDFTGSDDIKITPVALLG